MNFILNIVLAILQRIDNFAHWLDDWADGLIDELR